MNLYDLNPFRRNKSTSRLCRSVRSRRDLMHGSSIRSLLRTYERSTCSKPSIHRKMSIDYFPWVTLVHKVDGKTYSLSSKASLSICPRLPWVTLRSKQKQQQNENGGLLWKRVAAWVQRGRASTYGIVWSGEWGRWGEGVVAEAKISELIMLCNVFSRGENKSIFQSFDADFSSFSLAENTPPYLQITAYK